MEENEDLGVYQDPKDLAHLGNPDPEDDLPEAPIQDIPAEEIPEGYEEGDPDPEPLPEAAEAIEEEKPKLPKISIKSRINQLNREKYQALEIAERIQQENEELRRTLQEARHQAEQSAKAAMNFYDNSSELRMAQADKALQEAIESGDVQGQTKAQRELASIAAEIENAKSWKIQNAYREEQERLRQQSMPVQPPAYYPPEASQSPSPVATQWLMSNQWFDERSNQYNPVLAEQIQDFSDELDDHFYRNGMGHKVGNSPEYFNAINMRANELSRSSVQLRQPVRRGEIPMKSSRTPVAPVRSSSGYVARGGRNPSSDLTPAEKFWAKQFGVKDSDYKRERDIDAATGRRSWGGR